MKKIFNSDKKIMALSNCIHCGRRFSASEIESAKKVKKMSGISLMHITCGSCQSSMLLGVVNGKVMGVVGVGTDLTVGEVKPMFGKENITTDEVISLSEMISAL